MQDSPVDASPSASPVAPPVADRRPTSADHHGHARVDDYEWLRDKEAPEVLAYLEAENAYTQERTAHLADLRQSIFEEIKARTLETDLSVPVRQGAHWYYARTVEGSQYPIRARAPIDASLGSDAPSAWVPPVLEPGVPVPGEQVLLDDNVEAEGHDFFSLGSFDVSVDGTRLAYAVDVVGDERYTLRIRDLDTGTDLVDEVPGTFPGAVFSPDGRYVFYPTVDDAWRPWRVWRHEVGTPATQDVVVFEEPDERYWVGVGVSRSQRFVQIDVGSNQAKFTQSFLQDHVSLHLRPVGRRVIFARDQLAKKFGILQHQRSQQWLPQCGQDRVLDQARQRHALGIFLHLPRDPAKRPALWAEVQKVIYDETPSIKIGDFNALSAQSPKLEGVVPAPWPYFWNVSLKK